MTYLTIARSAAQRDEINEISPSKGTQPRAFDGARYEKNEINEISPTGASRTLLALQDEIVAAATAAQSAFDRAAYDELWRRWYVLQD
jgi:hypothetical protein